MSLHAATKMQHSEINKNSIKEAQPTLIAFFFVPDMELGIGDNNMDKIHILPWGTQIMWEVDPLTDNTVC